MMNLIETVKNIWRIEELRTRILITLGLLLVYRIGSYIVLPGVDSLKMASASTGGGGIVEILSIFTGGAFTRASIFALGIMPYISASSIMQLMGIAVPAVQKMQRRRAAVGASTSTPATSPSSSASSRPPATSTPPSMPMRGPTASSGSSPASSSSPAAPSS